MLQQDWFRHVPKHRFTLRSNSQLLQAAAARACFGLALLPCYVGDSDEALKRVDFGPLYPPREVWLLARAESLREDSVRIVADVLAQRCREL